MVEQLTRLCSYPAKLPEDSVAVEFNTFVKMAKASPDFKEFTKVSKVAERIDKMMQGVPTLKPGTPSKRYSMAGRQQHEWEKGFPQGASISPFLSVLSLTALRPKFADIIMYADDGIFYSDEPFEEQDIVDLFAK
jgi:hypothetical protein